MTSRDARLRTAFEHEWHLAKDAEHRGALDEAFAHLERAHILGQSITRLHVRSHLGMLRLGWRRRAPREVFGQLSRIVAATLFSRLWVPVGNTGGANVNAFRPMPLPPDLHALLTADADEIV
jgi:hypothetical protein